MSKPTLKQKIFRLPSKSYVLPSVNDDEKPSYYSSYTHMAMVAGHPHSTASVISSSKSATLVGAATWSDRSSSGKRQSNRAIASPGARTLDRTSPSIPSAAPIDVTNGFPTSRASNVDLFTSSASSLPSPQNSTPPTQYHTIPQTEIAEHTSDTEDGDSVYFTPLSTPETTPNRSPSTSDLHFAKSDDPTMDIAPRSMLPLPSFLSLPSRSTSRGSSKISDPEEDEFTFSWASLSDVTSTTSPPSSESAATSKAASESLEDATRLSTHSLSLSTLTAESGTSRHSQWAKDVRWLVPPERPNWVPPQPTESARRRLSTFSTASSVSTVGIPFTHPDTGLPMLHDVISSSNSSASSEYSMHNNTPSITSSHRRSHRKSHRRTTSNPASLSEKMSFILEEDEGDDAESTSGSGSGGSGSGVTLRSTTSAPPAPRRYRASTLPTRRSRTASVYSSTSFRSYQTSGPTVAIPSPLPSTHGTSTVYNAYSSLVLARAAFTPSKHPDRVSSQIDITKSGLAQTTMSTIEMTKGAASHLKHLPSVSRRSLLFGSGSSSPSPTPVHLLANLPPPLAFSARTPPPSRLQSNQVLVQVFMVGLDGLDALVVKEKSNKSAGYGFIPGRSFVGRTVECGFEVRNVFKGDWVYGLLDLHKCGSLAEFIVVDRRRIHRAPSAKANLSLEQVALLPLSGVPMYRALRTLPSVGEGKKALVFNAHDGIGALLVQALSSQGVLVTAHVPSSGPVAFNSKLSNDFQPVDDEKATAYEDRAREFGAKRVKVGDPLVVIAELSEGEFDYVLDTVGGRRIWEASRWILRSSGQFTTVVGDDVNAVPYMNSNLKSNLRSIRGAIKRDKGYEWVLPNAELDTEGEDVRDALGALVGMADSGAIAPWPKWAVSFEQTPEAFVPSRGLLQNGGTVVSKIVG